MHDLRWTDTIHESSKSSQKESNGTPDSKFTHAIWKDSLTEKQKIDLKKKNQIKSSGPSSWGQTKVTQLWHKASWKLSAKTMNGDGSFSPIVQGLSADHDIHITVSFLCQIIFFADSSNNLSYIVHSLFDL